MFPQLSTTRHVTDATSAPKPKFQYIKDIKTIEQDQLVDQIVEKAMDDINRTQRVMSSLGVQVKKKI